MATDSTQSGPVTDPSQEDYDKKTHRHRLMLSNISKTLVETSNFLDGAVQDVAQQLADGLQAECVCIFFRLKATKALKRYGLGFNLAHSKRFGPPSDTDLSEDVEYPKDSDTLMWREDELVQGREYIDGLEGGPRNIVGYFKGKLKSGKFDHLIIVPIRLFGRQFGAVRVINHLDPRRGHAVSQRPFQPLQDVPLVNSIAAMLALAYSNYRKGAKLTAVMEVAEKVDQAKTVEAAIQACLDKLASEQTGFPAALWRSYGADGISTVQANAFADKDLQLLEKLPVKRDEDIPIAERPEQNVIDIKNDLKFYHRDWALKYGLEAVYRHKISPTIGPEETLEVFADNAQEFDPLSIKLIEANARPLKNKLESLRSKSNFDRILEDTRKHNIVGNSPAIRKARELALLAAKSRLTVLLLGESGTGKQLFAKFIHEQSGRERRRFVDRNCAAFNENLLEDELFGHDPGAYTGADKARQGCFEYADGGTLFLDEIGDMPLNLQTRLLKALESGNVKRQGANVETNVDVRFIAATHCDLEELVRERRFRLDLFYRLNVFPITIPPLRERGSDDIDMLVEFFLHNCRSEGETPGIDKEAREALRRHHWPGNVRELENVIQRAVVVAQDNKVISKQHLLLRPSDLGLPSAPAAQTSPCPTSSGRNENWQALQKRHEEELKYLAQTTLDQCGGNIAKTANALGISRDTLYRHIGAPPKTK